MYSKNSISHRKLLYLIFASSFLFFGCNEGQMSEKTNAFASIKDVPDSYLKELSEKRIFFGHQSVGFNIINGIKDIIKENPKIKLNFVKTSDPKDFSTPLFAHDIVGKNTDPKSKIDAFERFMEKGIGNKADIAFFKFCYVDANAGTDVKKIFEEYKNRLFRLKKNYPETKFIHITIPLTSIQTGPRAWIKKLIGKPIRGIGDNIKRNQFNSFLKNEYLDKDPLFDLAKIESTYPDGRRSSFTKAGQTYYTMVHDYTNDGGHLNKVGRKIIAEQLLIFLAEIGY